MRAVLDLGNPERDPGQPGTVAAQFDELERGLDKVSKMVYNKSESRLVRWLRLMNAESIEEMKNIAEGDKVMEQAIAYVNNFLKEEGTTFQDKIEYEKAKSEAKGRDEDKKETAKNMLKKGYSVEEISEITNLSINEIKKLS